MIITSSTDVKIFYVALDLITTFNLKNDDIDRVCEIVKSIVNINDKCLLDKFSNSDRKKFINTILENASTFEKLQDDEVRRLIRLSSLGYIYDNVALGDYNDYITNIISDCSKNFNANVTIISDIYSLTEAEMQCIKNVALEDIAFAIGKFARDMNASSKWCDSYIYNDFLTKDLKIHTIAEVNKEFNIAKSCNIDQIDQFLTESIANISKNLEKIASDIATKNNAIDIDLLRKREQVVIEREIEVEKKSKLLDELLVKNKEFSLEIQQKAKEIDAKISDMAIQKNEFNSMLDKITDMCKTIVEMRKKIN